MSDKQFEYNEYINITCASVVISIGENNVNFLIDEYKKGGCDYSLDLLCDSLGKDENEISYSMRQALVIEAEVIHVSADRFIDEKSGEPYYEAKLKLTKKGIEQVKEYKFNLLPGMPAEVMIKIGERTPLSYFLKPFTEMVSRGYNEE